MRAGQAGFTLIEVLVSLALFAIIGGAGLAVLDQVLRAQSRTEVQLERLTAMQRAMHLLALDFGQAGAGSVAGRNGDTVTVGVQADGAMIAGYALTDDTLMRALTGPNGAQVAQAALLPGVSRADWFFLDVTGAWLADWPPANGIQNPRAVAVTLTLVNGQTLRRVVPLPGEVQ